MTDQATALLDLFEALEQGPGSPTRHPFLCFLDEAEAALSTGTWPDFRAAVQALGAGADPTAHRLSLFALRDAAIARFGFAVPTPAFASLLAPYGPFLEVGAGKGTLGRLLRAHGVPCISTDLEPWDGAWDVEALDAGTALARYPGRAVLCSWPGYGDPWLADLLPCFAPGQHLFLIGEGRGGCTGDDALFDVLAGWAKGPALHHAVWSWPGIHDDLRVWIAP